MSQRCRFFAAGRVTFLPEKTSLLWEDPPMLHASEDPERLIHRARAGDAAALGRLLELYRNYLRLLARAHRPRPAAAAGPIRPRSGDVSLGLSLLRRLPGLRR